MRRAWEAQPGCRAVPQPCVPVVPLPGLCPAGGDTGMVTSAVPWEEVARGREGAPELTASASQAPAHTLFLSIFPHTKSGFFCHKTLNLSEKCQCLGPPHYMKELLLLEGSEAAPSVLALLAGDEPSCPAGDQPWLEGQGRSWGILGGHLLPVWQPLV